MKIQHQSSVSTGRTSLFGIMPNTQRRHGWSQVKSYGMLLFLDMVFFILKFSNIFILRQKNNGKNRGREGRRKAGFVTWGKWAMPSPLLHPSSLSCAPSDAAHLWSLIVIRRWRRQDRWTNLPRSCHFIPQQSPIQHISQHSASLLCFTLVRNVESMGKIQGPATGSQCLD